MLENMKFPWGGGGNGARESGVCVPIDSQTYALILRSTNQSIDHASRNASRNGKRYALPLCVPYGRAHRDNIPAYRPDPLITHICNIGYTY